MPNHVTNILTISGKNVALEKCLKEIRTKGGKEINHIDFNRFAPMPKALVGTRSPMQIISEKEYKEQEERIKTGKLNKMEEVMGVSRSLTKKLSDQYKKKYGADNWYDWSIENWGTKWGSYDTSIDGNIIRFYTAWSTPYKALALLSAKYPELTFNVRFADEDFGANVGRYTMVGGTDIESFIPENGSAEAIKLALEIQGDDDNYYLNEYLCTDAIDNEFTQELIKVVHEQGLNCDGYVPFVLEKLKEYALADEQYERIIEIDKLLTAKKV